VNLCAWTVVIQSDRVEILQLCACFSGSKNAVPHMLSYALEWSCMQTFTAVFSHSNMQNIFLEILYKALTANEPAQNLHGAVCVFTASVENYVTRFDWDQVSFPDF
jgi:hypothetical protein